MSMWDKPIGEGTTTLDWLIALHPWLGDHINQLKAERDHWIEVAGGNAGRALSAERSNETLRKELDDERRRHREDSRKS